MINLKFFLAIMYLTRFALLSLVLKLFVVNILCDDDMNVELDSFEVAKQYDKKFIDWHTLKMRKVGRNQFAVNGTFITNLNIGNEQKLNLQIHTYDSDRKVKGPLIFNYEKEVCKFIAEDEDIYPRLLEVSNMPARDVCPMPKGSYNVKDFAIKSDFLPHDTPKGDYLVMVKLKNGLDTVAALEMYISIS